MARYALPRQIDETGVDGVPPGASDWKSLYQSTHRILRQAHGSSKSTQPGNFPDRPKLTNREAVALVLGWRALSAMNREDIALLPAARLPLWSAYVAHAYGWPDKKQFDTSAKQADAFFSAEGADLLWADLFQVADALDRDRSDVPPVIAYEEKDFDDPLVQGEARAALAQDGDVQAKFPIPIPKPDGDVILVDDPITAVLKSLAGLVTHPVVLIVVGAVLVTKYGGNKSRRGRRRNRHGASSEF